MADLDEKGLLSLIRDSTSRVALERYMVVHGVDPDTARRAAVRCEQAAVKNGGLGAAGLGLLTLFATSPVAGLGMPAGVALGMVLGAGGTVVLSKQCKEVQDAAFGIVNGD